MKGLSISLIIYKQSEEMILECINSVKSFMKLQDFETEVIAVFDNPEFVITNNIRNELDNIKVNETNSGKVFSVQEAAKISKFTHLQIIDPDDLMKSVKINLMFDKKTYINSYFKSLKKKTIISKSKEGKKRANSLGSTRSIYLVEALKLLKITEKITMLEDFVLVSQISKHSEIEFIDQPFLVYLFSGRGVTSDYDLSSWKNDVEFALEIYKSNTPYSSDIEFNFFRQLISIYIGNVLPFVLSGKEYSRKIKELKSELAELGINKKNSPADRRILFSGYKFITRIYHFIATKFLK